MKRNPTWREFLTDPIYILTVLVIVAWSVLFFLLGFVTAARGWKG